MRTVHGIDKIAASSGKKQQSISSFYREKARESRQCNPASATSITRLVAKMIATEYLPFNLVESESFRELMKYLEPGYTVPSRNTIVTYIEDLYTQEKTELVETLKSPTSVSLTTDCWTSITLEGYMTVTCHYIGSDWRLQSAVLDTSPVGHLDGDDGEGPQRHTAVALAAQLQRVAEHWDIDKKVTAVCHDNGSNVKNIGRDSLDVEDIGCCAHTLQLAINKGLSVNGTIKTLIGASSRLVNHFKHSTVAIKALETAQKQHGIAQIKLKPSCKTRWNSTYEMLRRLEESRWPICSVLSNPDYTKLADARTLELTNEQWSLMKELITCLKPLQV